MTVTGGTGVGPAAGSIARRFAGNFVATTTLLLRPPRIGRQHRHWRPPVRMMVAALIAVAAVIGAMILIDAVIIDYQRQIPLPVAVVFEYITDFGKSGWVLVPTGAAMLTIAALASPAFGRIFYLVSMSIAVRLNFVFFAVATPSLAVAIGKRLIGRARPPHFHEFGPFEFAPFSWQVDYASFPSGHGTSSFAAAVAIGTLYPRTRPAMWTFAVLIGLSRVVLAAHYPSDVVAGAAVGVAGALLVRRWFALRRLGFTLRSDGSVRALPGPSWQRIKRVARRLVGQ